MKTLIALAALVPQLVFAQAAIDVPPPATKPIVLKEMSLRPGDGGYTQEVAAMGLQGIAEISGKLAQDGTLSALTINASSRSPKLDEIALELVKKTKFKANPQRAPEVEVIAPVEFLRDSLATISNKTCAEFNADAAYFKTTFPEKGVRDMSVVNMFVGAFYVMLPSDMSTDKKLKLLRATNVAADQVEAACGKAPDGLFFKTFLDLVKVGKTQGAGTLLG
jgi:TonB family protein